MRGAARGQRDLLLGLATALAGERGREGAEGHAAVQRDESLGGATQRRASRSHTQRDQKRSLPLSRYNKRPDGLTLDTLPSGIVLDTYEGSRAPGYMAAVGAVAGFLKAVTGLFLRPSIGILEAASKLLQGVGLACTGKKGIQVRHKQG